MMFSADQCAALHAQVQGVMQHAAERALLPRYRALGHEDVSEKAPDELVTIADRESEAILSSGLARIIAEATIVGEEAADADPAVLDQLGHSLCWIIDPLDGTGNFVAGQGPFGILVALAERGVPIGGWILDPVSGRFVAGFEGQGTLIDGVPTRARGSGGAMPIAGISSLIERRADRSALLARVRREFNSVPIPRCAAEQYPAIILGRSDVTLFERTLPWDHAAGVLCLSEAGGIATRFDGSPYRVDDGRSGLLAASSRSTWDRVRALVDQAALDPGPGTS